MKFPTFRLFILGAGFSRPAGLPLGEELLSLVRNDVRRFYRAYGWEGTLEREIEEWKSLYPGRDVELERVLAYSHRKHYLRLLGSDEYFGYGSRTIVAAKQALQRILIAKTPTDTPSLYVDFASRLTPNDTVLTFNYDTLLEQAFEKNYIPYSLTPEWWLDGELDETGPKYVDVLKLHGSIDWYDRYYHDEALRWHAEQGHNVPDKDPIFGPTPNVPHESLAHENPTLYGENILSRVYRVPNHSTHFPFLEGSFSSVVPFILPPAYDKLLGYAPILDLWENLHRTQDAYSAIIIIGYSMPPYDSYAYETLGRLFVEYQQGGVEARWGHWRVPIQLVTLADSRRESLTNVPFLDGEKTRVWYKGFSDEALDWIDWG